MNCYVCEEKSGSYYLNINEYYIYKCSNCGLEYTYPLPTEKELAEFYKTYNDIRACKDVVRLNAEKNIHILKEFGLNSNSRVLDFGAGKGIFSELVGNNCDNIEYDSGEYRFKYYDFITLWGVLEHLPHPIKTIRDLYDRLCLNGILVFTTVNAESLIPYYYKPPEHLSYWTRSAFEILAAKCNLEVIKYEDYVMYQHSDIYLNRLLSRTPKQYQHLITYNLPDIVEIPTNEVFTLLRKVK